MGTRCEPQFYYTKLGFKGVFIARTCFPDVLAEEDVNKVLSISISFFGVLVLGGFMK